MLQSWACWGLVTKLLNWWHTTFKYLSVLSKWECFIKMLGAFFLSPSFITRGQLSFWFDTLILIWHSHFDRTPHYSSKNSIFGDNEQLPYRLAFQTGFSDHTSGKLLLCYCRCSRNGCNWTPAESLVDRRSCGKTNFRPIFCLTNSLVRCWHTLGPPLQLRHGESHS